jgi:hypothetical protein
MHTYTSATGLILLFIIGCDVAYDDTRSAEQQYAQVQGAATPAPVIEQNASVVASPSPTPTPTATADAPGQRGALRLAPDKRNNKTVWEFTIPPGTNGPWNTNEQPFRLNRGEILRIRTAEAGHAFHTGGQPCRHGGTRQYDAAGVEVTFSSTAEIIPNGYFECDIDSPVNSTGQSNVIYEHGAENRRIFMIVE